MINRIVQFALRQRMLVLLMWPSSPSEARSRSTTCGGRLSGSCSADGGDHYPVARPRAEEVERLVTVRPKWR